MTPISILRRDIARIREITNIKLVQMGGLWCEIAVDDRALEILRYHGIWHERLQQEIVS